MDRDVLQSEYSRTEKQDLVPEKLSDKSRVGCHPRRTGGPLSKCSFFPLVTRPLGDMNTSQPL